VHLLLQTNGGNVGEGISLYNLFRTTPFDLTVYNVGSICSIGVIAFLGAKKRKTSKYGTFMIHRAYSSPIGTSERLSAAANQMEMDDKRIEAILKAHTKIPADKWELHKFADVWLSADDAVAYDIAEIGEFAPPKGQKLFSVWPPQN
jgi:ATP-dependent Clp protease protease subunit